MLKYFTLKSEENRSYSKTFGCTFLEVFHSKDEPDRILVALDEPIPSSVYNSSEDLRTLIISPHFKGYEVYPEIKPLPCHVYMAIPKENCSWENGPYKIIDWGIIEGEVES